MDLLIGVVEEGASSCRDGSGVAGDSILAITGFLERIEGDSRGTLDITSGWSGFCGGVFLDVGAMFLMGLSSCLLELIALA